MQHAVKRSGIVSVDLSEFLLFLGKLAQDKHRQMTITVSPIQSYEETTSWFSLNDYLSFGTDERNPIQSLDQSNLWLIDSSQLTLTSDYAPMIAFINEGAWFSNRINLSTSGSMDDGSTTIFANLSGYNSILPISSTISPLSIGDWVELSTITSGTTLNFSVIPNGNRAALSTDPSLNPTSSLNPLSPIFWVAYADPYATNPVFILGYEDIFGSGSDNDYNDGIILLDLGLENFKSIYESYNFGQPTYSDLTSSDTSLKTLTETQNYVEASSLPTLPSEAAPFEVHSTLALFLIFICLGIRKLVISAR